MSKQNKEEAYNMSTQSRFLLFLQIWPHIVFHFTSRMWLIRLEHSVTLLFKRCAFVCDTSSSSSVDLCSWTGACECCCNYKWTAFFGIEQVARIWIKKKPSNHSLTPSVVTNTPQEQSESKSMKEIECKSNVVKGDSEGFLTIWTNSVSFPRMLVHQKTKTKNKTQFSALSQYMHHFLFWDVLFSRVCAHWFYQLNSNCMSDLLPVCPKNNGTKLFGCSGHL